MGGLCGRCWAQILAIDQRLAPAGAEQHEHRSVQAITGADLGQAAVNAKGSHAPLQKFIECALVIERSWTGPLFIGPGRHDPGDRVTTPSGSAASPKSASQVTPQQKASDLFARDSNTLRSDLINHDAT